MSVVEVRSTIPADLDTLSNVLVRVHAIDGYPVEGVAAPRTWIDLPEALGQWTALLDGEPVGHVALMPPGPGDLAPDLLAKDVETLGLPEIAVVARLFVDPRARGREAAKRLLDVVEVWALRRGLTPALDVMKKDGAAIRLYESRGWHLLG
ncbi:GNAT family N-acetyltransferase, partial [Burkholderia multivorans]